MMGATVRGCFRLIPYLWQSAVRHSDMIQPRQHHPRAALRGNEAFPRRRLQPDQVAGPRLCGLLRSHDPDGGKEFVGGRWNDVHLTLARKQRMDG